MDGVTLKKKRRGVSNEILALGFPASPRSYWEEQQPHFFHYDYATNDASGSGRAVPTCSQRLSSVLIYAAND